MTEIQYDDVRLTKITILYISKKQNIGGELIIYVNVSNACSLNILSLIIITKT